MKSRVSWISLLLSGFATVLLLWRAMPVHGASAPSTTRWNPQTAEAYLDSREVWWQQWPRAQKDHGTICISCHTTVPYAMARPALRRELSETAMAAPEKVMVDSVEKRVSHWSEMIPFYSDEKSGPGKTVESHSTEAVLNAIILASYDARQGHLRPITRTAFDAAWELQLTTGEDAGGWKWQDFHLGPWESSQSAYQGAALLMFEAANAPDGYAKEPAVRPRLESMREYLRRQHAAQPLMNQLYVLWASTKEPGLLTKEERKALLTKLQGLQQPDGGWQLSSMIDWKRVDDSAVPTEEDGFATSLAVLVMEQAGTSRHDSSLSRGLAWIEEHQQKEGNWPASSMNKQRDSTTDIGRFMSDAATAYAVLALEKAQ
jgi:squalene-hopene/tetraprenyl-beta-curcumene cyclase